MTTIKTENQRISRIINKGNYQNSFIGFLTLGMVKYQTSLGSVLVSARKVKN